MNTYIVGTLVEIDATFKDGNNALVDPTTVNAQIRIPDGTIITNLAVQKIGTGQYATTFIPEQNGLHTYRFTGEGDVVAAQEGSFMAQSTFPT